MGETDEKQEIDWAALRTLPPAPAAPCLLPTRPRGRALAPLWQEARAGRCGPLWLMSAEVGVEPARFANRLDAARAPRASDPAPDNCPVLLYCLAECGASVLVVVNDWKPWLDVDAPLETVQSLLARTEFEAEVVPMLPSHGYAFSRRPYLRLRFRSAADWRAAKFRLRDLPLGNVQCGLLPNFFNEARVSPATWSRPAAVKLLAGRRSTCQLELEASFRDFEPLDWTRAPRLVYASFDIEAYSPDGRLPRPWVPGRAEQAHTICVSVAFWTQGDAPERAFAVTLFVGDCREPLDPGLPPGAERSANFAPLSEEEAAWRDFEFLEDAQREALLRGEPVAPLDASRERIVPERRHVRCYADFASMYEALRALVCVEADADVICGFNNYGFDSEFLWIEYVRAKYAQQIGRAPVAHLPAAEELFARRHDAGLFWGRRLAQRCLLQSRLLETAAAGRNYYRLFEMSGRASCDVMQIFQKEDKGHQSYALGALAARYSLPTLKIELPPHAMFALRRENDPHKNAAFVLYCERDARIPLLLYHLKSWHEHMLAFSAVTCTPLEDIFNRGQGIRTNHMILRRCFQDGICPIRRGDGIWQSKRSGEMLPYDKDAPLYEGAIVLPPRACFVPEPVTTLDYGSLYPSCIQDERLDPMNIVLDEEQERRAREAGFEVHEHTVEDQQRRPHTVRVVWDPRRLGFLEKNLAQLRTHRKAARQKLARTEDEAEAANLDALQNALKVVMNSAYGYMGAPFARFSFVAIAALTTMRGRVAIQKAVEIAHATFAPDETVATAAGAPIRVQPEVIYGDTDSIFVHFGLVRNGGLQATERKELRFLTGVLARRIAANINDYWKQRKPGGVMEIVVENIKDPMIAFEARKNYAYVEYKVLDRLEDREKGERKQKGLAYKRRDFPKFIAATQRDMCHSLLDSHSADGAFRIARERAEQLAAGRVAPDQFAINKSVRDDQKVLSPQYCAYLRMLVDGDADPPPIGGRLSFVIMEGPSDASYLRAFALTPANLARYRVDIGHYWHVFEEQTLKVLRVLDQPARLAEYQAFLDRTRAGLNRRRRKRVQAGSTPELAVFWGAEAKRPAPLLDVAAARAFAAPPPTEAPSEPHKPATEDRAPAPEPPRKRWVESPERVALVLAV